MPWREQLAGALAATHAAGGVHRDVKGGNILVSPKGPRAVLMDFGAGTYAGAAPLTREALPPGTDDYRSPEAWEYALQRPRDAMDSYAAQPPDDVFALGVCAYRLVPGGTATNQSSCHTGSLSPPPDWGYEPGSPFAKRARSAVNSPIFLSR